MYSPPAVEAGQAGVKAAAASSASITCIVMLHVAVAAATVLIIAVVIQRTCLIGQPLTILRQL